MQTTIQDLTYAVRSILKARGFAAVAILTIALGHWRQHRDVHRRQRRAAPAAAVCASRAAGDGLAGPAGARRSGRRMGHARQLRRLAARSRPSSSRSRSSPAGVRRSPAARNLSRSPASRCRTSTSPCSASRPIAGRAFTQEDDVPNARRVVVIGHGLWKRRFGGDVSTVGRTVTLSGEPHEIVGVLPEGFRPIVSGAAEIWRPSADQHRVARAGRGRAARDRAASRRRDARARAGRRRARSRRVSKPPTRNSTKRPASTSPRFTIASSETSSPG